MAVEGGQIAYRVYGSARARCSACTAGPAAEPLPRLASTRLGDLRVVLTTSSAAATSEPPDDPSLWTSSGSCARSSRCARRSTSDRIDLFGHSFGGMLAQEWSLAHPDELRTLTLASTFCSIAQIRERVCGGWPPRAAGRPRATRCSPARPRPATPRRTREFSPLPPVPDPAARAGARGPSGLLPCPSTPPALGHRQLQARGHARRLGQLRRIDEIRAPTLITVGRHDEVTPACAASIRAGVTGSESSLPSSAHIAHWEERGGVHGVHAGVPAESLRRTAVPVPGLARSWWLQEALALDPGAPCPPLDLPARADVCIVGGGYTGLWTALELRRRSPDTSVIVIEARHLRRRRLRPERRVRDLVVGRAARADPSFRRGRALVLAEASRARSRDRRVPRRTGHRRLPAGRQPLDRDLPAQLGTGARSPRRSPAPGAPGACAS